jgi:hypothetical protein
VNARSRWSEFEGAALQFELEKMRISADKEVRIAAAKAMGEMLAKAQMQIFGDPTTMATMAQQFMSAAGLGVAADGLLRTMPAQGQEILGKVATAVASSLAPKTENGNTAVVSPRIDIGTTDTRPVDRH